MNDFLSAYRRILYALPGRLALALAPTMSPAEVSELIRKEFNLAMVEMISHKFNEDRYEELARARYGLKKKKSCSDTDDDF